MRAGPYDRRSKFHEVEGNMTTANETLQTALKLHDAGQLDDAERLYREAVKSDPRLAPAWHGLGLVAHARGDAAGAIDCLSRAVLLNGAEATYHNDLGAALQSQSRLSDATASYRRALALRPDYAEACCNLGSAHKDRQQFDEAIACYRRALDMSPNLAEANFNLGVIHQQCSRVDEAIECYERAVTARTDYWQSYNNLGTMYKAVGRFDDAMAAYDQALRCQGGEAEAHRNRALLRLLKGNYSEGWTEYEWRWQVTGASRPNVRQPRWQGQALAGGTVLLKAEQGLGDAIQFIRYAPMVKERSRARVLLQCSATLRALFAGVAGVDGFASEPWERESFDCYVPLMSLPALFETRVDTVPWSAPYLSADPDRVKRWQHALAAPSDLKVGIAWQGNPGYAGDATRSIPLAAFAPLAACPGLKIYSLQKQHGRDQLNQLAVNMRIEDFGDALDADAAFVDTAAVMSQLDLVVTSDTAVAHLAGALGVRVWLALQQVADWRWLLERDDSPWYPSMRLFRQTRAGDWDDEIGRASCRERV
jgi:tetratricopeptide (TPR) repeat protein